MALRWPGRFSVEGPGQALVCPVLLWSARGEALMADTERDPLHRELAQAAEGRGGTRGAVVGAHGLRQAILLEEARKERA